MIGYGIVIVPVLLSHISGQDTRRWESWGRRRGNGRK